MRNAKNICFRKENPFEYNWASSSFKETITAETRRIKQKALSDTNMNPRPAKEIILKSEGQARNARKT